MKLPSRTLLLFAVTVFLSALLLFWIQLVMAKMLLPRLGGTPAVWNTCMLFFQVLLLAGYAYVMAATTWLAVRKQAVLHVAILLLSCLYLPLTFARNPGSSLVRSGSRYFLFQPPALCCRNGSHVRVTLQQTILTSCLLLVMEAVWWPCSAIR
jgi:hypothetical protein